MHKIDVCWQSKDFVDLDYEYLPAYGREDMCRYQSPIYKTSVGNWVYHLPKPMPHFVDQVIERFNYRIKSPAINKLTPGQVLPLHKDLYTIYKKVHGINDIERIERYIIFLEDCENGHFMQIEDKFITQWTAGDVISWQGTTKHAAYNMGTNDRYVMQLTCYDKI